MWILLACKIWAFRRVGESLGTCCWDACCQAGLLGSAFMGGYMLFCPVFAMLANYIPPSKLMALGTAGVAEPAGESPWKYLWRRGIVFTSIPSPKLRSVCLQWTDSSSQRVLCHCGPSLVVDIFPHPS